MLMAKTCYSSASILLLVRFELNRRPNNAKKFTHQWLHIFLS